MPHRAIIGMTTSGKTECAIQTAKQVKASGRGTLVLHKEDEPWPADAVSWQTDDPEKFLRMFYAARNCDCFMELSDGDVDKYDVRFHRCFTKGRHLGHRCYYLTQYAGDVHPKIRGNCVSICLFAVDIEAAKKWAAAFNDPALLGAVSLPPHQFLFKPDKFTPATLKKLAI